MRSGKIVFSIFFILVFAGFHLAAGGQRAGEAAPAGTAPAVTGKVNYPIKTDVTLTYWVELYGNVSPNFTNLGSTPFGQALMEKTGIKVQFIHPAAGAAGEQFNLIVASGDLPDIIEYKWLTYSGGPEKAINDGVILRLNDFFKNYSPNMTGYLAANPEYDKMIKTDNGDYYAYPFIRGDEKLCTSQGLMLRQDWLDELGLQVPVTIDEWHSVLTAFKEKKKSPAPFTFEYNTYYANLALARAYKAVRTFYVGDDKKVHYGAIEPGYRDWLTTFSQWYKEGLVDPDFPTMGSNQVTGKIVGSISGAAHGTVISRMGAWTNAARATNPQFKLSPAPVPVLNKGEKAFLGTTTIPYEGQGSAAITTKCKNADIAARFLDWGYSREGYMLNNFGIEGVSYTMVNGAPVFTSEVLNNPKGLPISQASAMYCRSSYYAPFIQDLGPTVQTSDLPEQKDALNIWPVEGAFQYLLPPISPTPNESQEFSRIMQEVNTYTNEMILKYILGTENLNTWDNYVSTVKRMGIDRAIEIQNAALDRYNAR